MKSRKSVNAKDFLDPLTIRSRPRGDAVTSLRDAKRGVTGSTSRSRAAPPAVRAIRRWTSSSLRGSPSSRLRGNIRVTPGGRVPRPPFGSVDPRRASDGNRGTSKPIAALGSRAEQHHDATAGGRILEHDGRRVHRSGRHDELGGRGEGAAAHPDGERPVRLDGERRPRDAPGANSDPRRDGRRLPAVADREPRGAPLVEQ